MDNLNKNCIYFPKSVVYEIQSFSKYYVLWISGLFGTWFLKIPSVYKLVVWKNKFLILQNKYHSINNFYSTICNNTNTSFNPTISAILIQIKRLLWGAGIGFKKYLRVRGVGYKFGIQKNVLQVNVGFTHTINKKLPQEFFLKFSRKAKMIKIRSKSLIALTTTLSAIRSEKKPDVYKGKGIRYKKEFINKKEGKKKKSF